MESNILLSFHGICLNHHYIRPGQWHVWTQELTELQFNWAENYGNNPEFWLKKFRWNYFVLQKFDFADSKFFVNFSTIKMNPVTTLFEVQQRTSNTRAQQSLPSVRNKSRIKLTKIIRINILKPNILDKESICRDKNLIYIGERHSNRGRSNWKFHLKKFT